MIDLTRPREYSSCERGRAVVGPLLAASQVGPSGRNLPAYGAGGVGSGVGSGVTVGAGEGVGPRVGLGVAVGRGGGGRVGCGVGVGAVVGAGVAGRAVGLGVERGVCAGVDVAAGAGVLAGGAFAGAAAGGLIVEDASGAIDAGGESRAGPGLMADSPVIPDRSAEDIGAGVPVADSTPPSKPRDTSAMPRTAIATTVMATPPASRRWSARALAGRACERRNPVGRAMTWRTGTARGIGPACIVA